eukprot:Sspe_Gene.96230::Locus_68802_Transcript_1_1_Confidence_1.000_Length_754::g.96230::m.96230
MEEDVASKADNAGMNTDPNKVEAPPTTNQFSPENRYSVCGTLGSKLKEVSKLRSEVGLLERLQRQIDAVREENIRLKKCLDRGYNAMHNDHALKALDMSLLHRENEILKDQIRSLQDDLEMEQKYVHLAFEENKGMKVRCGELIKEVEAKDKEIEALKKSLAHSESAHRATVAIVETAQKQKSEDKRESVLAKQECLLYKDKLAQSHNRQWKMERELEKLRREVLVLRDCQNRG